MRTTTELWVKAYVRRRAGEGCFAGVLAHGDDRAGAIWIKINALNGEAALYSPAPAGLDTVETERRFVRSHTPPAIPERDVDARLAREREFDPDLWIVEVEDRRGEHGLDGWLATPSD